MFKPSLRRSVLNDTLCMPNQGKKSVFQQQIQQKIRPIPKLRQRSFSLQSIDIPSMMVPQQILQKNYFTNNVNYTHVFTPLSYDFKAYPYVAKQLIKRNPKAAQAGRFGEINYLLYQKSMVIWKSSNSGKQSQILKVHKFHQAIDIAQFSVLSNTNLFKFQKITIVAISFGNAVKLYKVDENQLKLQDLMLKYKLKSCRKIQKIKFTNSNQIILGGDSGQISMVSFNKDKQMIVNVKSPIIKKYLSKSAFDFHSRFAIKQIQIGEEFIYCMYDRIQKSNYLMYFLKKTVNNYIKLSQQPKYIHEETFIDIYKFSSFERKQIVFVDQLKQKVIQKKLKEGYSNYWGQGVSDGLKIVSIHSKSRELTHRINLTQGSKLNQMKNQQSLRQSSQIRQAQNSHSIITIITKCGYMFSLIHSNQAKYQQEQKQDKQNFSFLSQPTRLVQKIGQVSLFQPKIFLSSANQKQYRKNFIVKSLFFNNQENLILFNNSLMLSSPHQISLVKFDDLKTGVFQTTTQQKFYISSEDFNNTFQNGNKNIAEVNPSNLFPFQNILKIKPEQTLERQYFKLFNIQKRWTVFDNEGRFHIYALELRHLITAYLYYQYQLSCQYQKSSYYENSSYIQSDLRLHSAIQKMIRTYGYINFSKALIEILVNNSSNRRQFFYLQKQLFFEIIKRQFQYELPSKFQDWFYSLSQRSHSQKIVPTKKILQHVWITLFEYQHMACLNSEAINSRPAYSQYLKMAEQYSQVKQKLQYSAYGFALKSLFFNIIQHLVYFRANQFKIKQKQLRQIQSKLLMLSNFIQNKITKSETNEYKSYLTTKLNNLSKKKEQYFSTQNVYQKNINTTFSTNYSNSLNNSQQSLFEDKKQPFFNQSLTLNQSNQKLQRIIHKSISKIILLIEVMGILIEKDQRQILPNFIEIVTNFSNQIKIGEIFFKQQLLITQNIAEFVHPELVRQLQIKMPQLQLNKKIQFLKFKTARNIPFGNTLSQIDLKTLNFDRLSSIIRSSDINELRKIFIGFQMQNNWHKVHFYVQFLSICLAKSIQKVKQLSTVKQQKFQSLSQQMKLSLKRFNLISGENHFTVEKIVQARQQLEYYQKQMSEYFQQIKFIFSNYIQFLKNINGPKYYQAEKYLQRIIELLIQNFGLEEILVQSLEFILKDANLVEKIHFVKRIREKQLYKKDTKEKQILTILKEKQFQKNQKSTFQYLLQNNKKNLSSLERTYDTSETGSYRN